MDYVDLSKQCLCICCVYGSVLASRCLWCGVDMEGRRRAHQQQGVSHQEPKCYTSRLGALSGAFTSK